MVQFFSVHLMHGQSRIKPYQRAAGLFFNVAISDTINTKFSFCCESSSAIVVCFVYFVVVFLVRKPLEFYLFIYLFISYII